ncbi:MAG: DNA methyltransferase, partial [Acidimicrobiales bacterium]
LYTYEGDVVLDPFMGSGSSAVAALRTGRHFLGYDTDAGYVLRANQRVLEESALAERPAGGESATSVPLRVSIPAQPGPRAEEVAEPEDPVARAVTEGRQATQVARILLESCGFVDLRAEVKVPGITAELSFVGRDRRGDEWAFDVWGAFTVKELPGLRRVETMWRALGKAAVLHAAGPGMPLVLLTTGTPARGSAAHSTLNTLTGPRRPVLDVVQLLHRIDAGRLHEYASRGRPKG